MAATISTLLLGLGTSNVPIYCGKEQKKIKHQLFMLFMIISFHFHLFLQLLIFSNKYNEEYKFQIYYS